MKPPLRKQGRFFLCKSIISYVGLSLGQLRLYLHNHNSHEAIPRSNEGYSGQWIQKDG